jgi:hypothetical protein
MSECLVRQLKLNRKWVLFVVGSMSVVAPTASGQGGATQSEAVAQAANTDSKVPGADVSGVGRQPPWSCATVRCFRAFDLYSPLGAAWAEAGIDERTRGDSCDRSC